MILPVQVSLCGWCVVTITAFKVTDPEAQMPGKIPIPTQAKVKVTAHGRL
jgi:hypothetical protein